MTTNRLSCRSCGGTRLLEVSAKCDDLCSARLGVYEHDGYVPNGLNIGGGDYVEFQLCLDCGRLQGNFPILSEAVKKAFPESKPKTESWWDKNQTVLLDEKPFPEPEGKRVKLREE